MNTAFLEGVEYEVATRGNRIERTDKAIKIHAGCDLDRAYYLIKKSLSEGIAGGEGIGYTYDDEKYYVYATKTMIVVKKC